VTAAVLDLGVAWCIGLLVAFPVVRWWAHDLARIPGRAWYWTGHHLRPWQWAVLLGWLAGGWPAIAVVAGWARSQVRADLLEEAHLR
jgi:hypothetical protein